MFKSIRILKRLLLFLLFFGFIFSASVFATGGVESKDGSVFLEQLKEKGYECYGACSTRSIIGDSECEEEAKKKIVDKLILSADIQTNFSCKIGNSSKAYLCINKGDMGEIDKTKYTK